MRFAELRRWLVVVLFAIAMAWLESAVVFYLRTMVDRLEPYQPRPLPILPGIARAEIVREAATLIMLATLGWLAGSTARSRFGYFVIAFGVWDIFYYLFLKVLTPWPRSVLDWDLLFLIPLPWWGPVLAPCLIAALMVIGGSALALGDDPARPLWPGGWAIALNAAGSLLALYVFMADPIRALPAGAEAVREVLPVWFNWPLFLVALALMAVPVVDLAGQIVRRRIR